MKTVRWGAIMANVVLFRPKSQRVEVPNTAKVVDRLTSGYTPHGMPATIETILQAPEPFRVGDWLVEPTLNRLSRGAQSTQLELKAMDVLLCLAARAGEVVPKHEVLDAVWQTEFVSDNTLARRIAELREALGDDAQQPRYIETIRKRGYRLIAEVGTVGAPGETDAAFPPAPPISADESNPYPGLAAFAEADADVFFGRESEVTSLWRKISSRRLLGVIGPSGSGKTSLLRAGVVPVAPPGWRVVVFNPGGNPSLSLARALAPDHAGDPSAVGRLVGITDPDIAVGVVSRWRGQWHDALFVIDQFEELFTLNPPEVQSSFIRLLRRLVDAADVHIVLVIRHDFLTQCQQFQEFTPIFKDLTAVALPSGEALRRALKEPAARRLYRFESELLVDEMIADVEAERGALPLLAFAVHRLWEERDRERCILTERAYHRIGGVAGALALHAEHTLDRIGDERRPLVRELFRNLVTAQGTRSAREVEELLSVFEEKDREAANQVLRDLVDARLLTSYELHDENEEPKDTVEIIHESLLTTWPRLVRWQAQDADAAQLRDQLRQAARTWEDRGRPQDLLWTGTVFKEFDLWRDRYPGSLTYTEDAFAIAMTEFAGRRQRRRRFLLVAVILLLSAGLVGVGALWRRSVVANSRAEAQKLNALGRLALGSYPSAAVAHAIASLELADSREARLLALEALWKGPTMFVVSPEDWTQWGEFSRDGQWLVQTIWGEPARIRLNRTDGSAEDLPLAHEESERVAVGVSPGSDYFWSWDSTPEPRPRSFALWSAPQGELLAQARYGADAFIVWSSWARSRTQLQVVEGGRGNIDAIGIDGKRERLGSLNLSFPDPRLWFMYTSMDQRTGRWLGTVVNNDVVVFEIGEHELSGPRRLGRHEGRIAHVQFDPFGRFFATAGMAGDIRLWDPTAISPPKVIQGPSGLRGINLGPDGSYLAAAAQNPHGGFDSWIWLLDGDTPRLVRRLDLGTEIGRVTGDPVGLQAAKVQPDSAVRLWTLTAPAAAEPLALLGGDVLGYRSASFHPNGKWLATTSTIGLTVWPLARRYPVVIEQHDKEVWQLAFAPDGSWLASTSLDGTVRLWPLAEESPDKVHILLNEPGIEMHDIAVAPDGDKLLVSTSRGVRLLSVEGDAPRTLQGFQGAIRPVAFSLDGRLAAAVRSGPGRAYVWELASGRPLVPREGEGFRCFDSSVGFTPDGRLLTTSDTGLQQWNLKTGDSELLVENVQGFAASADGRRLVLDVYTGNRYLGGAAILDLETGFVTHLDSHGDRTVGRALDVTGDVVVTVSDDGAIRVGLATGEEPHLLLGRKNVFPLAVDPRGRWIASAVDRTTICLWPMPDLSKPPLHTLPRDELLATLKSLTNIRLVPDERSPTGWTLKHDPFPGWETVPSW